LFNLFGWTCLAGLEEGLEQPKQPTSCGGSGRSAGLSSSEWLGVASRSAGAAKSGPAQPLTINRTGWLFSI